MKDLIMSEKEVYWVKTSGEIILNSDLLNRFKDYGFDCIWYLHFFFNI